MAISILEHCQVSPSQGAATEQLLPLLYFDMIWLPFRLTETLYFYDFQCSESHFLENIVPNLKNSLSLTLKHFLPLAGKIVFPLSSTGMPVSHYVAGDSISLIIAVSNADFVHLTGNHSRDADEFHDFVPQMPPAIYSSHDLIKFSAIAAQVTSFSNHGICVGFTMHHAICDATNLFGFVQKWASTHKFKEEAHVVALGEKLLPFYDRSVVQDANRLATIGWNQLKMCRPTVSLTISLPTYKVRGTFVLSKFEIQKLKNFVMNKKPAMAHVSSFMVACGHLWSCLAKSAAAAGEEVADDEPEYLTSPVDCRARLNPPLPDTYFGNCLVFLRAESTHERLKGNEGFVAAVEAIGKAIHKTVNNDRGILDGFENQLQRNRELFGKRVIPVGASPRFDPFGADYGWGRPKKFEFLHIDFDGSVSLCKSREGGGVEIGMSMPKAKMDAFSAFFKKNICINSNL